MPLVKELDSQTLVLGRGDKLALIRVDIKVLTSINKCKVLCALNNQENYVLDIEDEWGGPVHHVVDIALRSGANHEMIVLHAHVNYAFPEIEIIVHFMKAIIDADFVLLIKCCFDVSP